MSVLDGIRKTIDNTSVRMVIGGVLLAFVFWNVSGRKTQVGGGVVATVNGEAITETERRRMMRAVTASMTNRQLKGQEAQIMAEVEQRLIQNEALLQEAERMGLYVSADEVKRYILSQDSLKGEDGKFSEKKLKQLLKGNELSQGDYEEDVRQNLMVQKLSDLVLRSVTISDAEAFSLFKKLQTKVKLQFVRISPTAFLGDITIPDSERDAFIAQNKQKIEDRYKQDYDRFYNLPKKYQLGLILLRTDIPGVDEAAVSAKATQIQAEAASGKDFAELARRYSEDLTASSGGGMGKRPAAQFDPEEIKAADATGVGKVSAVIKTSRGFEILHVEAIEDARVIDLATATPEIAVGMMKDERVGKLVSDFATSLLTSWSQTHLPPVDLLTSHQLMVESTDDFQVADPNIPTLGENAEISLAISTAPAGTVLPKVYEIRGLSYVVVVGSRDEPTQEQFDAQKAMIRRELLRQRQTAFWEGWADEVVARTVVEKAPKPEEPKQ